MNKLEIHIYDNNLSLLDSDYNVSDWNVTFITNVSETVSINQPVLNFNIHNYLRNNGYSVGQYIIDFRIYDYIAGNINYGDVLITTISDSRTELILKISDDILNDDFTTEIIIELFDSNINNILNLGDADTYNIVNWRYVSDTEIQIKIDKPLDDLVIIDTNSIIGSVRYNDLKQPIQLIDSNKQYNVNILSTPNFDIKVNSTSKNDTKYENWNDLLSDETEIKNLLTNQYFNFYEDAAKLNIDYTDYTEFVFYSSAENRLINFRYKLHAIQNIESNISNIDIDSFIEKYNTEIEEIRNSFDGYEYFLYYNDGDYAWPKDTNNKPLLVSDETSIIWFNTRQDFAQNYDLQNLNTLTNLIPSYIMNDEFNSQFIVFVNMIAQHFDILWLYTKHILKLHDKNENINKGISKDLIYQLLSSYGWNPQNDNQFDDLWSYAIGKDVETETDDTIYIKPINENISTSDINIEVWKRILNNLPYLLKTKGTKEGVRALINCYGVRRTELYINEYGGPNTINEPSVNVIDKFNYAIKLNQLTKIIVPYFELNTIQFRFKLTDLSDQTIFQRDDGVITLKFNHINDEYGVVNYNVDSYSYTSELIPFFNENWWSFMLKKTDTNDFQFITKQTHFNKITHEYSGSLFISGSNLIEVNDTDHDYYIGFNGFLQEFRYWNTSLDEIAFNNHVTSPTSYNGNTPQSPYSDLIYRLPLGSNTARYNHNITTILTSQHPSASGEIYDCIINGGVSDYVSVNELNGGLSFMSSSLPVIFGGDANSLYCDDALTATFINFDNEYNYEIVREKYSHEWPDISGNRTISTKIRIQDNELLIPLDTKLPSEDFTYNTQPSDNSKIGVYFGPNNEVSQDIAEHMASVNIDDYIGTFDTMYSTSYPKLEKLRAYYFQQYYKMYDVKDYFHLMKYYKNSLFKHIEEITPGRSNKITGLVIEPHILNRSKLTIINDAPIIENLYYAGGLDATSTTTLVGGINVHDATLSLDVGTNIKGVIVADLHTTLHDDRNEPSIYKWNNLIFNSSGNSVVVENDYWLQRGVITVIESYTLSENLMIENPLYGTTPYEPLYIRSQIQEIDLYKPSKISSIGWNEPSHDTPNNEPVVEFWVSDISLD